MSRSVRQSVSGYKPSKRRVRHVFLRFGRTYAHIVIGSHSVLRARAEMHSSKISTASSTVWT